MFSRMRCTIDYFIILLLCALHAATNGSLYHERIHFMTWSLLFSAGAMLANNHILINMFTLN